MNQIQFKKEMRLRDRAMIYTQNSEEESGQLWINHVIKSIPIDNKEGHEIAKLHTLWQKRDQ